MYRVLVCSLLLNLAAGYFWSHDHHDSCNHGPGFGPGPDQGFGPGFGPWPGPWFGPGHGPGHGPEHGPGFGPGSGPGHGPGHGPEHGPEFGPGFGPGHGPGHGPEHGPGFGPGSGPGHGPGHGPGDGQWDQDHPCQHHNGQKLAFDRLAQCVGAADQIQRDSCTKSSYNRTREFNGAEFYALKYMLSEFTEDRITVKVKNRVLYVTATKEGLAGFEDLRILPHFLNVSAATWYFNDGLLVIMFPYKNQFKTDVSLTCDQADDKTYEIPKQPVLPNDLRFLGFV